MGAPTQIQVLSVENQNDLWQGRPMTNHNTDTISHTDADLQMLYGAEVGQASVPE